MKLPSQKYQQVSTKKSPQKPAPSIQRTGTGQPGKKENYSSKHHRKKCASSPTSKDPMGSLDFYPGQAETRCPNHLLLAVSEKPGGELGLWSSLGGNEAPSSVSGDYVRSLSLYLQDSNEVPLHLHAEG